MNDLIQTVDWTTIIITLITTVIVPLIALLLNELQKWIHIKYQNALLDKLAGIVRQSVSAAKQEMVDQLKSTNSFDAAKVIEVKEIVKQKFLSKLTESTLKEFQKAVDDTDYWIDDQIEEAVVELKR